MNRDKYVEYEFLLLELQEVCKREIESFYNGNRIKNLNDIVKIINKIEYLQYHKNKYHESFEYINCKDEDNCGCYHCNS
jgi:hypothetical protein